MDVLYACVVAFGVLSAVGAIALFARLWQLPNQLYAICLRTTCVLMIFADIVGIVGGSLPASTLLYHVLYNIATSWQAISFAMGQLEFLRLLLPFYGIASETVVTRIQIVVAVLGVLYCVDYVLDAVLANPPWILRPLNSAGTLLIALYDVVQQLLMLHFTLFYLKSPLPWFRTKFTILIVTNVLLTASALLIIARMGPNSDLRMYGLILIMSCIFIQMSVLSMILIKDMLSRRLSGLNKSIVASTVAVESTVDGPTTQSGVAAKHDQGTKLAPASSKGRQVRASTML
ncbi:hypothetical protein HK105_200419 [Polyrhizophydium stewartii]|uniref:Integral membrane protein n=1 Tax=Polyrhizophydium stewartii TaxID=2732419 RepID=A0ABR4NLE5_9FUNG